MSNVADRLADVSPIKLALLAREARARREVDPIAREPIAITGIGCRFPGGADGPTAFWRLLRDGVDAISEVPRDRWDADAFFDPDPDAAGKTYTRWGGFLDRVDLFDADFFGISPREAVGMDPQQRLLLEVAWEALEDAGLPVERLAGSRAGVFVGVSAGEYPWLRLAEPTRIDAYAGTGNAPSIAANRLSYLLDLRGPSLAVDTACSSSVLAVHLACRSLRAGECDLALAGGVNVMLTPQVFVALSRARMLAADGRCKTFDARADGYTRGEGCGVVVLKRLSDALADGDPIWALIRGSAVNQDGRSNGLTAPSGPAQQAVIRRALAEAGVPAERVGYVEAHGTGTSLGDPIEVEALAEVLRRPNGTDRPCALGSVKTAIGHLEAAAGIAGLIKATLALHQAAIPPHLHFRRLNPNISLAGTPFVIPTELRPWPRGAERRFAGVSSFGFGGTNVHLILEEAPPTVGDPAPSADPPYLLPLSARSPEVLRAQASALRAYLTTASSDGALADVCYTAALRRTHHAHRLAVVGDRAEILGQLDDGVGDSSPAAAGRLVFVCSGQGTQWAGMGRELLEQEPVFRAAVEECDELLRPRAGWSLLEVLRADDAGAALERTDVAQPAIFAVQVGLGALWRSWGIAPDAVVGHSLGEVTAAYLAGALDLGAAVRVVWERGRLMHRAAGQGGTVAVQLSAEAAERAIAGLEDRLAVAAINGPRSAVLAGEAAALRAVVAGARLDGVRCHELSAAYAFHSPQMEPLRGELEAVLAGLAPRPGAIPLYSTVSGRRADGREYGAAYWGRNIRATVRFAEALARIAEDGHTIFVELSPQPALGAPIAETLHDLGRPGVALPSLRRGPSPRRTLLGTLGRLYALNRPVAWERLYPHGGQVVRLPTYAWQRERYWVDAAPAGADAAPAGEPRRPAVELLGEAERRALLDGDPDERRRGLLAYLREQVGRVLERPSARVDPQRPLHSLGLDSLMATDLKHRIERDLGVDLPIGSVLEGPSVAQLAALIVERTPATGSGATEQPRVDSPVAGLSTPEREALADRLERERADRAADAPLSFAQQRLWVLHQLDPTGPAYNIPLLASLHGSLDRSALERSLAEIRGRHDILRTSYDVVAGQPTQLVGQPGPVPLSYLDLLDRPRQRRRREWRQAVTEAARRPFDLRRDGPVRALLARLGPEEHGLLVVVHHIACDGWSVGILARELAGCYAALAAGRAVELSRLPCQYADFARREREQLSGAALETLLAYWRERLAGAPATIELPIDRPRPPMPSGRAACRSVRLERATVERLQARCRDLEVTPFMALLAALEIVLYRWTGQRDLVVGTVVANREGWGTEQLIGCFINFLPLRIRISGEETATDLLGRVRTTVREAYAHQACPFELIVQAVGADHRARRSPLYNVALVFQGFELWKGERRVPLGPELVASFAEELPPRAPLLDLRFVVQPAGAGLRVDCEYDPDLFEPETVADLLATYRAALEHLIRDDIARLGDVPLSGRLAANERPASGALGPLPRPEGSDDSDDVEALLRELEDLPEEAAESLLARDERA